MQPSSYQYTSPPNRRPLWALVVAFVVLLVLALGFMAYRASKFHIVSTDPKLSAVSDISPGMNIYFNKVLVPGGFSLNDPQHIVSGHSIKGKVLALTFTKLNYGQKYALAIRYIAADNGEAIRNKSLGFTTKDIDFNHLSKNQQQAAVNTQDKYPYTVYSMPFRGFDDLTSYGLTTDQEQAVKVSIFTFSNTINQKFTTIQLVAGSIQNAPYNPNTDNSRILSFSMVANGISYGVSVSYDGLSDASATISDSSGNVIYQDSPNTTQFDE